MSLIVRSRPQWPYALAVAGCATLAVMGAGGAALERLGTPIWAATLLLMSTVVCRSLKVRTGARLDSNTSLQRFSELVQRALLRWRSTFAQSSAVALSVGGVLVPLGFSVYALLRQPPDPIHLLVASAFVAGVSEFAWNLSVRGAPALPLTMMPPATALLLGWAWGAEQRTALVYVSGLAGILIGADLLHLRDLRHVGRPEIVVGADTSFDAIFVNQVLALFLT